MTAGGPQNCKGRGVGRLSREFPRFIAHNFLYVTAEGMATNFAFGMTNPFLAVYALALGANSLLVGLVTALPALVNVFAFILAARVTERQASKLPTVMTWTSVYRLFYLPLALVPFIPASRPHAMVAIVSLMAIPSAIANTAWTAMMGDIFPENKRGSIFGLRNMYVGLAGTLGTLGAGYLLDGVGFPLNWTTLFVIAFGISMVGVALMGKLLEPANGEQHRPLEILKSDPERKQQKSFSSRVKTLMSDAQFGRKYKYFSMSCFILWFGFGFTAAMWPIYHVRYLHLSNSTIGNLTVTSALATVASSIYWGRMSSRKGERVVLLACMAGLAVFPALYTLSPSISYLLAMQVISGISMGGLNLAVFNLMLNYAQASQRANATAVFNMLINFATFIAPFMGDYWYESYGLINTFYAGTVIRLISLAVLWKIMDREIPGTRTLASMILERRLMRRRAL